MSHLLAPTNSTGPLSSTEEFPGSYNFTVLLNPLTKPTWVYSEMLNQIFIEMGKVMVVNFQVNSDELILPGMKIRVLIVYSSVDHLHEPVVRCVLHSREDDLYSMAHTNDKECKCKDYNLAGHIVRTEHPTAEYHYDDSSERHSLLIPFPYSLEVPLMFACKNSCINGMQRRPTQIVFTLEDDFGKVHGRRLLALKICSCPKRDKERMERDSLKECKPSENKRRFTNSSSLDEMSKIKRQKFFDGIRRCTSRIRKYIEEIDD